jgi:hypothetical protein
MPEAMPHANREELRTPALLALALATLACLQACSDAPSPAFPEYHSKDLDKPVHRLARVIYGKTDGYGDDGVPAASDASAPFGDAGQRVATLRPADRTGQTPLTLMLDLAGAVGAEQGKNVYADFPVSLALVCRAPQEACEASPPSRESKVTIQAKPRAKLSANPWSYDGASYSRVKVDGVEMTLVTGQQQRTLSFPSPAWEEADLVIAFPREIASPTGKVQLSALRATLLQGEFSEAEPSQRMRLRTWLRSLTVGPWTVAVAAVALIAMVGIALRARKDEASEDAPRIFGTLVLIWGWALAAIPLLTYLVEGRNDGLLYYAAIGLPFALSGLYAVFGRPAAKFWFLVGYVLATGWTYTELDFDARAYFMRLGMPTLVGVYLWYLGRAGRLAAAG